MRRSCLFFILMSLFVLPAFSLDTERDRGGSVENIGEIEDSQIKRSYSAKTREILLALPGAGSPWAVINLFPGIIMDGMDVGGSELARKVLLLGTGAEARDTTWHMDGAVISDPDSLGTAPTYLNLNFFEEVQVTTGVRDITSQTGGVQVNFVTRRGGNRLSGDVYGFVQGKGLEMKQTLPESMIEKGWSSTGINSLLQYGLSLGGPIIKDKVWFFGAYGMQDIETRDIWGQGRPAEISSLLGKVDFQFGGTSGSFQYQGNRKATVGMPNPDLLNYDPNMVWDLDDPHEFYLVNLGQVLGNLELNAQFSYTDNQYILDPWGADINPETGHLEGKDWFKSILPNLYDWGSLYYYSNRTKGINLTFDGSYYAESFLGGDHEIRFGVDFYIATTTSQQLYPNQRLLYIDNREQPELHKEVWWIADRKFDVGFRRSSFYLSDEINLGRLDIYLGLRYDREAGAHNATTAPGLTFKGTPIFTPYLGDLASPGRNIDITYHVFSPRISLTLDICGDGQNLIKASYARYGSQSGNGIAEFLWEDGTQSGNSIDGFLWEGGNREIDVFWDDDDDMILEWGEWSEHPSDWIWWNFTELDPYCNHPLPSYDRNYNSPILTEIAMSYEQYLGPNFAIALNAYYKKRSNLTWSRGLFYSTAQLETADDWYRGGTYLFSGGLTTDYYLQYKRPNTTYQTNYGKDTYDSYKALQLVVSKKLSHGWMLDASFTWQDWKRHMDEAETFDKTNFDFFNDGAYAPQSQVEGMAGVYVNSRWLVKLAGMVQLPLGFNLTGVFQAREGYITPYYELFYRTGIGWTKMYEPGKKFGDDRLPAFWMLDLGLEKTFRFSDTTLLTLLINGYNITNNKSTLNVDTLLGTNSSGDILRILNPGIFQVGARLSF